MESSVGQPYIPPKPHRYKRVADFSKTKSFFDHKGNTKEAIAMCHKCNNLIDVLRKTRQNSQLVGGNSQNIYISPSFITKNPQNGQESHKKDTKTT